MAERGGMQIPWASIAVVVAFVSSTLLVPKAFDVLRPPEKERAQPSGADLEVDARLWEDPFFAVRRHEADRVERCKAAVAASTPQRECDLAQRDRRRSPAALRAHLDADGDGEIDAPSTLLIAVLVPGNPVVGAEESRRRTRFALLAGLQAEGYSPDSAEQIGLMQVPIATVPPEAPGAPLTASVSASASAVSDAALALKNGDQVQVPYELLSRNRSLPIDGDNARKTARKRGTDRAPFERVAVMWVDEAALPSPKLDGVARLLHTVIDCHGVCPRLAVVGPSSSDALNTALSGLDAAAKRREQMPDKIDWRLAKGYKLLAEAYFYSPTATTSEKDLPLLRSDDVSLQSFLTDRFTRIVPERAALSEAEREVHFMRTIAPDDVVVSLLAGEVLQRLPSNSKSQRRIVTVVESDSIYARGLERRFRYLVGNSSQVSRIDQAYFFRGIDGVTQRDAPDRQAAAAKPTPATTATTTVEWPEARDQLDYLRRMADELKRSESAVGGGPIGAIGIFANDVHDKLLLMQALHDTFPDKVFFTTDMDARYLHPRVLPFTRNLVVASSLPLQIPPQLVTAADGKVTMAARQVQEGTPPMRDVYQTATYLAARFAACRHHCEAVQEPMRAVIDSPSVYEIGRSRAVAIDGFDAGAQRQQHPGGRTSQALAVGMALMLVGLLVWPSTPAMRQARTWWLRWPCASAPAPAPPPPMTSLLTVGYGVWLGFAAASLMEATAPGSLGLRGAGLWAVLGGLAATLLSPGLRYFAGGAASGRWVRRMKRVRLLQVLSLLLLASLVAFAVWVSAAARPGQGEPLLWLEGISGWPSHFLHLAAVLAVWVSADVFRHCVGEVKDSDALWLGQSALKLVPRVVGNGPRWVLVLRDRLERYGFLAWHRPATHAVEFIDVWQRYQQRGLPVPRLLRVLFWYVVTVGSASLLFRVFTDHYIPEMPVRGAEHRAIIFTGLLLAMGALPALVVAVADATLITCRFMRELGGGRTLYRPELVARFARELGDKHEALWVQPVAADPAQRDASPPLLAHSLLDDWIDIQMVARQTRVVAWLIVAPFVVLALLLMARSRLFDSWAMTWPVALAAAAYLLWLVGLAVALKWTAEKLRRDALARMQADLRWLGGAKGGLDKLVEPFKRLISAVETNTTGAFAATFDQPLVASLLVPLGGAGGVQLLDYLLLAR